MGTLAGFLRTEMDRMGLSQSGLARRIGVPPEYIRRWLLGEVPRPNKCEQIAKGLGVPVSSIMELAGYPSDAPRPGIDREKEQALREFERILDEAPRQRWPVLERITRSAADALAQADDVPPDPREHQTGEGRDNVKTIKLPALAQQAPGIVKRELVGAAA